MKKILILIITLIASLNIHGQTKNMLHDRYTASVIGIKAGINHSYFKYTAKDLKSISHELLLNPNIGISFEYYINNNISLAPELFLYNRGNVTKYDYENIYKVTYQVKTRYITTRLPIYFRFNPASTPDVKPFVIAALSYNHLLGGNINLTQPNLPIDKVNIDVGKANMRQQDLSIFLGIGSQFYINCGYFSLATKLEFGYNMGLSNSFSEMEINENSTPTNVHAYNITGKRRINNLEFNIYLGLPIKFSNDECSEFNRTYPTYSINKKKKKANRDQHKKFLNMPY